MTSATLERGSIEWQKARIKEICADYFVYARKNHKILDKDGQLVPFELNRVQRRAAERIIAKLAEGVPVRFIILKARQMGFSTLIESIISWWTSTHKNVKAMITAHLDDAARNIYEMFRRYYDHSLPSFKPVLKYNTRSDLSFEKLGSQIKTASAENGEVGRSGTNQVLHNSEVAFWKNGQDLVAGLLQTVPYRPNTMVFHESTANGIGGYFYDTWQAAKRGESPFEPMFFAWFELEEYRLPVSNPLTLNEDEQRLKDLYQLDDEQIAWRRMKLQEFRGDTAKFRQEYPSNDMEAFIASGRPRFDIDTLLEMEQTCMPGDMGEIVTDVNGQYRFTKLDHAPLQVWKLPERLDQYVIGADVAEGLEHGDYSVAQVIDRKTREQVARLRIHCDPDVFGDYLFALGMFYNRALLGSEVNNHGLTTLQRLKDLEYPNLYQREGNFDKTLNEISASTLGWRSDSRTKPLMIDYAATAIRERSVTLYDLTTVREHMTYVLDENGRTNAQEGCFDDCVVALAIALQMFEWSFTPPETQSAYHNPNYR